MTPLTFTPVALQHRLCCRSVPTGSCGWLEIGHGMYATWACMLKSYQFKKWLSLFMTGNYPTVEPKRYTSSP